MKKIVVFCLSLVLLFSLCACTDKPGETKASSGSESKKEETETLTIDATDTLEETVTQAVTVTGEDLDDSDEAGEAADPAEPADPDVSEEPEQSVTVPEDPSTDIGFPENTDGQEDSGPVEDDDTYIEEDSPANEDSSGEEDA